MAFTDAEKVRILYVLGRSIFENDGDAWRAVESVDNYEAAARPIIDPILCEIEKIDRQLSQSKIRALAIEDGSTKLDAARELAILRSHGRQAVGRLARFLKVSVTRNQDIYSPTYGDSSDMDNPTGYRPIPGVTSLY